MVTRRLYCLDFSRAWTPWRLRFKCYLNLHFQGRTAWKGSSNNFLLNHISLHFFSASFQGNGSRGKTENGKWLRYMIVLLACLSRFPKPADWPGHKIFIRKIIFLQHTLLEPAENIPSVRTFLWRNSLTDYSLLLTKEFTKNIKRNLVKN